ncbi:S8 family serine peptidase [Coralloluteibacterium stylophorae]|uniref:S8 family serine peptidase n=1 Tax=Coralloluteibacterium stylophorae TaxID=1776034 RepID=A0A8J8AZK0_9GAMM|nr:S8 family serine peptidase [Coralloluteibacterium stylophorae]MBS7456762.1 S8 family serine peptidase [Coralloluteibacterium stylophorae]
MKQTRLAQALAIGLAMGAGIGGAAAQTARPAAADPAERVIVQFKAGAKPAVTYALARERATVNRSLDRLNAMAVTVPASAVERLRQRADVESVRTDPKRYPLADTVPYGIDLIGARDVWDADRDGQIDAGAPTGDGSTVCVIDSGIVADHVDFEGVELLGGYPDNWNTDVCGHGTHVAGTITAALNDTGVVGVSPGDASLFIVKVFGDETIANCVWSYASDLADAAYRCADAGADVVNMSLGGDFPEPIEEQAFQDLADEGILSVAAAGNDANTAYSYPASYPIVVSVGGVDANKAAYTSSQRNDEVDVSAPAVSVMSTYYVKEAELSVDGNTFFAQAVDGTFEGTATGTLVDGGRCTASDSSWSGMIVLCERGDISFAEKNNAVVAAGGIATIIYNNVPGAIGATLNGSSPIPVLDMSQQDGQTLVANYLGQTATVSTIPEISNDALAYLSGTSMATPHVAGAAAVLMSANPEWTNYQVRRALEQTAEDLGEPGRDDQFGHGLIDLPAALEQLQTDPGDPGPDPDPDPEPTDRTELEKNVPVTGLSAATGETLGFYVEVPVDASDLEIVMSGGTGDADLYVRFGDEPTATLWDCRPYLGGNNEVCSFEAPEAGTYYVDVTAYTAFSGVSLVARYLEPGDPIPVEDGELVRDLSGAAGDELVYTVEVPAGASRLRVMTSGGSGDLSLYAAAGEEPTPDDYDHASMRPGNNEIITISSPAAGTWYFKVVGERAFARATFRATID